MHRYTSSLTWNRGQQAFLDGRYSRRHLIRFDGGIELHGSSSPLVVKVPFSDASAVDPEELFVASLSSCHMLWFLSIAASQKFCVDRYDDSAFGDMETNASGKSFISTVTLRPKVRFSGDHVPNKTEIEQLHGMAHEECFIANSVRTDVRCEPIW